MTDTIDAEFYYCIPYVIIEDKKYFLFIVKYFDDKGNMFIENGLLFEHYLYKINGTYGYGAGNYEREIEYLLFTTRDKPETKQKKIDFLNSYPSIEIEYEQKETIETHYKNGSKTTSETTKRIKNKYFFIDVTNNYNLLKIENINQLQKFNVMVKAKQNQKAQDASSSTTERHLITRGSITAYKYILVDFNEIHQKIYNIALDTFTNGNYEALKSEIVVDGKFWNNSSSDIIDTHRINLSNNNDKTTFILSMFRYFLVNREHMTKLEKNSDRENIKKKKQIVRYSNTNKKSVYDKRIIIINTNQNGKIIIKEII